MYNLFSGLCMWSIVKQLAAARLAHRERSLPWLVTSTAHVPKNRIRTILSVTQEAQNILQQHIKGSLTCWFLVSVLVLYIHPITSNFILKYLTVLVFTNTTHVYSYVWLSQDPLKKWEGITNNFWALTIVIYLTNYINKIIL